MKKHKSLEEEIQQGTFVERESLVYLNLLRTTELVATETNSLLRTEGLSHSQYNVLRIIRGSGQEGICGRDIVERMVTRDSDMTRLLDGLEKKKLVKRVRCDHDRRLIHSHITEAGNELLERLEEPLLALHRKQFSHLGQSKLATLNRMLEECRYREEE